MQSYQYIRDEIWEHLRDSGSIKDFFKQIMKITSHKGEMINQLH